MTILTDVTLTCPVCEREFRSHSVVKTDSFGGKKTDFQERSSGTQPLPYFIHSCPYCGYSGEDQDFGENNEVWSDLKSFVYEKIKPLFEYEGYDFSAAKYEAAALIGEYRGERTRRIADLYLRAAWCCVNCGDREAERYYRLIAAEKFRESLLDCVDIDAEERAVITYLIGELWRRIGDKKLASMWFQMVKSEIVDEDTQSWVVQVAEQQNGDEPREWFG